MIEISLGKRGKYAGRYTALVSDIDADLANLNWSVSVDPKNIPNAQRSHKGKTITLARTVMERILGRPLEKTEKAYTIDGDTLNNTRENLTLKTPPPTPHPPKIRRFYKNNSSGYRGVSLHKHSGLYRAYYTDGKNQIFLGYRKTAYEAFLLTIENETE